MRGHCLFHLLTKILEALKHKLSHFYDLQSRDRLEFLTAGILPIEIYLNAFCALSGPTIDFKMF